MAKGMDILGGGKLLSIARNAKLPGTLIHLFQKKHTPILVKSWDMFSPMFVKFNQLPVRATAISSPSLMIALVLPPSTL